MVIRTDSLAVDTLDVEQIEEKVDRKSDEKQIPDKVEQNSDEVGLIEFPEQKIENVVMKPKKFEGKTRLMRHSKLDSVKIK
jgi:stress-induced morphogen